MSIKKLIILFSIVSVINLFVPVSVHKALADITCENSDYNCIYVVGGSRIVCTRSFCGGNPSQFETSTGSKAVLEGLYAFDGNNPNTVTTTTAATTTTVAGATTTGSTTTVVRAGPTISVSGPSFSASGTGTCSYTGGTFLDAGFTQNWNTVNSPRTVDCNWSGSFAGGSGTAGQTYYVRIVFTDSSGSVTGTSSFIHSPDTTTTTTLPPVTTTTIAGAPVNPCLDPANPNYVCGWAVLGANNAVGNIIVCTYAVCGSGSFGGMRLVLQTQQQEGGNVAGWNGGSYDEKSQTFSLPGGGTLKSGSKLEEAVFPTTTTSTTSPSDTVPDNNSASEVKAVAAPSGVVYESAAKYVAAETETVMSTKSIEIKLPVIPVRELKYEVSFDPAGTAQKVVIETGKIVRNLVIENESKISLKKLSFFAASSVKGSTISVDQKMLKNRNGLISVTLRSSVAEYAQVNIKVTSAKKYSSCKELNKDYPGGIVATAKWVDVKTSKQKVNYVAKPVNNVRVYNLNQKLDLDKDKIVCETNN